MKTKIIISILAAMVLILGFAGTAEAAIVDISLATNKPVYTLGEDVVVFVIAYNPNPESVTLSFGSALQTSYLMDGVFDWTKGKWFADVVTRQTIEPYGSFTWDLIHGPYEMSKYPLGVGSHTVEGYVVGYGNSALVEFEVIPEPSTFLILVVGFVAVRIRHFRVSLR